MTKNHLLAKNLWYAVLGGIADLAKEVTLQSIDEVFIAMLQQKSSTARDNHNCKDLKVSFKIVPRSLDIIQGKVSITQIKPVDPADLIGREIVKGINKYCCVF